MMPAFLVLIIFIGLFAIEIFYFKVADHFNIIDKPNSRSSHSQITLRGGGIIFTVAGIIFFLNSGFELTWFTTGLVLISGVSFLDDICTLGNKFRLSIHLLAVLMLFLEWNFGLDWYYLLLIAVFIIATLNAYNFMDGINGITGSYSLLAILTLYYINDYVVNFTSSNFLIIITLSLLVFNFFNFRIKAKCFAGDVGSMGIAFILIFLLGQLIWKTQNLCYIFLLLLYGLDSVVTIVFRAIRKENVFKAHRSHFYQFLANERQWPHLLVSGLYFVIQLIINVIIIISIRDSAIYGLALLMITGILFLAIRFKFEGHKKLIG